MLDPKKKVKKYVAAVIVILVLAASISGLRIQSVKHYKEEQRKLADDIIVAEANTGAAVVVQQGEDEDAIDGSMVEADTNSDVPDARSIGEPRGGTDAPEDSDSPKVTEVPGTSYSPQETENSKNASSSQEAKEKNTKSSKDKDKHRNSDKSEASSQQTTVPSGRKDSGTNGGTNSGATNSQKEVPKNPQKTPDAQAKVTQKPSPAPTEEKKNFVCEIAIRCDSILKHMDEAEDAVKTYIPADGIILGQTSVKVEVGDTAYSLLQKVCQAKDIALDASYTNAYSSSYVRGIGHIYEKQVGLGSGWLYLVNGKLPGYGASRYKLKEGDRIEWVYSCTGKLE